MPWWGWWGYGLLRSHLGTTQHCSEGPVSDSRGLKRTFGGLFGPGSGVDPLENIRHCDDKGWEKSCTHICSKDEARFWGVRKDRSAKKKRPSVLPDRSVFAVRKLLFLVFRAFLQCFLDGSGYGPLSCAFLAVCTL